MSRLRSGVWWGIFLILAFSSAPVFAISDQAITDWLDKDQKFNRGKLKVGVFEIRPRLSESVVYDDNIYIRQAKVGDFIGVLAPGLSVGAGQYMTEDESFLMLDYTALLNFYAKERVNNAVDHNGSLRAELQLRKLNIGVAQTVYVVSGSVIDVGERVNQRTYTTALNLDYELTGKINLEVSGQRSDNHFDAPYNSYVEWLNQNWANYTLSSKVRVALGVTLGFDDIADNPAQNFQRLLVRTVYVPSEKTSVTVVMGGEWRHFEGAVASVLNPVFSLGATYKPVDATTVSFNAYRSDQTSIRYRLQNYSTTGFDTSVRQRFLQKLFFTLGGGYRYIQYTGTTDVVLSTDRQDDYFFVRSRLDWNVTERFVVELFYLYRRNISNVSPFSNNQVGLQSTFLF